MYVFAINYTYYFNTYLTEVVLYLLLLLSLYNLLGLYIAA